MRCIFREVTRLVWPSRCPPKLAKLIIFDFHISICWHVPFVWKLSKLVTTVVSIADKKKCKNTTFTSLRIHLISFSFVILVAAMSIKLVFPISDWTWELGLGLDLKYRNGSRAFICDKEKKRCRHWTSYPVTCCQLFPTTNLLLLFINNLVRRKEGDRFHLLSWNTRELLMIQ